jgi:hypothetical protein
MRFSGGGETVSANYSLEALARHSKLRIGTSVPVSAYQVGSPVRPENLD